MHWELFTIALFWFHSTGLGMGVWWCSWNQNRTKCWIRNVTWWWTSWGCVLSDGGRERRVKGEGKWWFSIFHNTCVYNKCNLWKLPMIHKFIYLATCTCDTALLWWSWGGSNIQSRGRTGIPLRNSGWYSNWWWRYCWAKTVIPSLFALPLFTVTIFHDSGFGFTQSGWSEARKQLLHEVWKECCNSGPHHSPELLL